MWVLATRRIVVPGRQHIQKPDSLKMPQESLCETGLMLGVRLKTTILIKTATQNRPFGSELLTP